MRVDRDTVVVVNYTLTVQDGETPPDLNRNFTARFIYGRDRVLPVLEKELFGLEPDDTIEVTIPPEQAFGQYDPKLVNEIPKTRLAHPERLKKGAYYEEFSPGGRPIGFLVKEIHDDYVVADFNHPAAGKTLLLKARVEEVKAATAMEILASMNLNRGGG